MHTPKFGGGRGKVVAEKETFFSKRIQFNFNVRFSIIFKTLLMADWKDM